MCWHHYTCTSPTACSNSSMDFAFAAALCHFFNNSKSVCSMMQALSESERSPRSSRSSITASALPFALPSFQPSALPSFQPSALPSAFFLFKSLSNELHISFSSPSFICVINSPRSYSFSFRMTLENHVIHSFKSFVSIALIRCISSAMPSVQSCLVRFLSARNMLSISVLELLIFDSVKCIDRYKRIFEVYNIFSKQLRIIDHLAEPARGSPVPLTVMQHDGHDSWKLVVLLAAFIFITVLKWSSQIAVI